MDKSYIYLAITQRNHDWLLPYLGLKEDKAKVIRESHVTFGVLLFLAPDSIENKWKACPNQ